MYIIPTKHKSMKDFHNLSNYVASNNIRDCFGAMTAYIAANKESIGKLINGIKYVNFYSLILVVDGFLELSVNDERILVEQHDMLRLSPHQRVDFITCSPEYESEQLFFGSRNVQRHHPQRRKPAPCHPTTTVGTAAPHQSERIEGLRTQRDMLTDTENYQPSTPI